MGSLDVFEEKRDGYACHPGEGGGHPSILFRRKWHETRSKKAGSGVKPEPAGMTGGECIALRQVK